MEINGLPLHALVVHAAVVFAPLAAIGGVLYAVPRFRDWLRWPLLVALLVAVASIWVSYLSGEQLERTGAYTGVLAELLETHESRAAVLRIVATAFAVVGVVAVGWLHRREGVVRLGLAGVLAALAVATGVYTVLVGDAGAQIGWYGVEA